MNYVVVVHRKEGFSPLHFYSKQSAEAAELFRWLSKCDELVGIELCTYPDMISHSSRGFCDKANPTV